MRLVYITLARKILCYGSFPAKVLLGTNAYNSQLFYGSIDAVHNYLIRIRDKRFTFAKDEGLHPVGRIFPECTGLQ